MSPDQATETASRPEDAAPPAEAQADDILPAEGEEIAKFCSKCGTPKGSFDVFCGNCAKPLVRRFAIIFPVQLVLFLGSGIVLSLAHAGVIPGAFRLVHLRIPGRR